MGNTVRNGPISRNKPPAEGQQEILDLRAAHREAIKFLFL